MRKEELKQRLKAIAQLGFVETKRSGNTGVGYTLESLLGIEENNYSGEDIEGVGELKTKRRGKKARTTSLCQSPDFYVDKRTIIRKYGRPVVEDPERINFYPSFRLNKETPQGLTAVLIEDELVVTGEQGTRLFYLPLNVISFAYRRKFGRALIFVTADCEKEEGQEKFHYNEACYCSDINLGPIRELLEKGKIIIEPRIWMNKTTGKIRDHGMAFRMSGEDKMDLYTKKEIWVKSDSYADNT